MARTALRGLVFLTLLVALCGYARASEDKVSMGDPLTIGSDEIVDNAVCIGCPLIVLGEVRGDAVALGGPIRLEGRVGGDSICIGGSQNIYGAVGGDAVVVGGPLELQPGASVGADAVSVGGHVDANPGSTVGGEIAAPAGLSMRGLFPFFPAILMAPLLFALIAGLLVSMLCFLIVGEKRVRNVAETARSRTGASLLGGVLAVAGFVFAIWVFAQMRGLTPLLVIGTCLAFVAALVTGYTGLSYWFGSRVANTTPLAAVIIGTVIISFIQLVPIAGWALAAGFFLIALGASVISGFGTAPRWLENRNRPAAFKTAAQ